MLLKCSTDDRPVSSGKGKGKLARIGGTVMRMTMSTGSTMSSRIHRKVIRIPSKRHPGKALPGKLHSMTRTNPGKLQQGKRILQGRTAPSHCDNSNDSGLGFDHHMEPSNTQTNRQVNTASRSEVSAQKLTNPVGTARSSVTKMPVKRLKLIKKIDIDDTCSNDAFVFSAATTQAKPSTSATASTSGLKLIPSSTIRNPPTRPVIRRPAAAAQPQIGAVASRDGKCQLQILAQPEQQHRARYQTEGSRGAVKDRSGNGFPIVKLTGYNKPTVLEIFIGTDIGRVAPHMFYQACKVSGKNSTPCVEKKLDGTIVIEIELKPDNEMTATCDCVGILKERNVDVEHRFPDQSGPRSKKKSTRCRMVFRTQLTHDDGTIETLQICSQQIICTQPPGVPEICKRSLKSCTATGGLELFIIGKNFLKDTRVVFQARRSSSPHRDGYEILWEETCLPDKEYLQQTHLICTVPPYANPDINESVTVQLFVTSSNKKSESHSFVYTPKNSQSILMSATSMGTIQNNSLASNQDITYTDDSSNHSNPACPLMIWTTSMEPIHEIDSGMMPPPSTLPLSVRRPSSAGNMLGEQISPPLMKTELNDESSQSSLPDTMNHDALDRMTINENSMDGSAYVTHRIRKRSIDIMDSNSMMGTPVEMLIHDSNSLGGFASRDSQLSMMPSPEIVDLRIKQEQMAAQLHQFELANKVEADLNQSVNKFLSNLDSSSLSPRVDSVAVALYSNNSNNDALLQEINNINNLASTNSVMNPTTFNHSLLTENDPGSSLSQMLTYPQNQNNESMMDTSNSNHSHDVILNSQPAASINSPNSITMLASPNVNTEHNMSSDVILNPAVSPSMMCQSADSIPPQVTSVLACHPMQQQSPQDTLLNNLMQTDSIHIPRTSPVAVKNMILNAAADILSSQPSQISAENTINALISLNSSPMITQASAPPSTMMMHGNNQSALNEAMCTQTTLEQHMPIFNNESSIMATNPLLNNPTMNNNTANMMNSISISNMVTTQALIDREIRNDQIVRAQHEYLNDLQKNMTHGLSNVTQESLLEAVSLQRNELNKEKVIANQLQNMQNPPNTTTTSIPQELTIMSDNDLISYINPSCFDTV
ncbi:nuclear factor of activated T-cells 5 isoform X2 [Bradysia coprophila]|uniref:nuclear factor of activated T-cells 5 isoform X2 n=1 Tax=Bradysia coprophila TaxID=38358 RepID=UPI00187D8592|nr:nuclear factor of activated T-cells 5 isoform X2 [Bradysia coprophila]XP_037029006.1 nuclear factor of activated T-cells 5 isoform X2 [Bradysia coprophila]XP_037029007.1 nuclear factor of activated T-cells 5 isoform X2 [Bradysia coprophila]